MRSQSVAKEDSPAGMIPAVRARMPWRVTHVEALSGFRIFVRFVDGLEGTVDMDALIRSENAGVFASLSDPSRFDQVHVEHGAVTWPDEIDLAPDAMYKAIKADGEWKLTC